MTDPLRVFEERYALGLQEHVACSSEATLQHAYESGRQALAEGLGILHVAGAHHRAMALLTSSAPSPAELSESFLLECLAPFEMAHRGTGEANAALRHLTARLEEEARRIAHALHDDAGQLLSTIYLAVDELAHDLPPDVRERVRGIKAGLDQLDERLRQLAHELSPPMLAELGLLPAIKFLADGVSGRAGLSIDVADTTVGRLAPPVEITLYRVVKEALNNVAKHARATRVHVGLALRDSTLHCTVRDDGQGFDVLATQARPAGLGVIGMRERLEALGGQLVIRSSPGRGTELDATVPVGVVT